MTQEIIPAYSTFQKDIDLTLYHAFTELVVQTAQDGEARILYRQLEARQIWQEDQNVSSYFEAYSLRYPGEVLERFEEKLGTDIRILRALALALGYTRRCQADTMFVGNQRNDFIQKLRRTAGTDVYLQGALYLLETDALRRRTRLDELAAREYARTEEALFVLSLFDDPETGYQAMRPQLTRLFGPERTISMARDFGVLEWFIRFYAEEAKRYRGKNDLVLRTLMKLPYMNMKPDSREFSVLHTAGYSMEEITMANSLAVWADRIPDRLSSKGIVAEKIAVACVRMLLNGPDGQPEEIYAYISWLFQVYKKFEVRYEGYQDLWAAIQTGLAPTAPQTILWMNQTIKRQFPYRFDVFDPRYDILANELSNEEYAELFTVQMLRSRAAIPLRRWLTRYQALTGVEYIEYALLFEDKFCEHCNLNSLTARNLQACDSGCCTGVTSPHTRSSDPASPPASAKNVPLVPVPLSSPYVASTAYLHPHISLFYHTSAPISPLCQQLQNVPRRSHPCCPYGTEV